MVRIGFWAQTEDTSSVELPWPGDWEDDSWDAPERDAVIAYLRAGRVCDSYRGLSSCRLCGSMNGSCDLTDGTCVWPDGLAHYLEAHAVRLPQSFVDHAASRGETCPETCLGHVTETAAERDARCVRELPGRYEVYAPGVVGGIGAVGTFAICLAAYRGLAERLPALSTLYIRRRFGGAVGEIEVRLDLRGDIAPTSGQQSRVRRALRDADVEFLSVDEIADRAQLPYDVTAAALRALESAGDIAADGHYRITPQGRAVLG